MTNTIALSFVGTENEKNLIKLEENEYIHPRSDMFIEKLDDEKDADDGIYILLKEILDNSIDEFRKGAGQTIEIGIMGKRVEVRDYGRGIPLQRMIQALSFVNMGMIEMLAFKGARHSINLSGVAAKTVNALSEKFTAQSFREGESRKVEFLHGRVVSDTGIFENTNEKTGTFISFEPDDTLFPNFTYKEQHVESILRNYTYLNPGLTISFNRKTFFSPNGLLDLLRDRVSSSALYPIVHLKAKEIELAFTHVNQDGETYYSFVNGEQTTGGTHQSALRKHLIRTIKKCYSITLKKKAIRNGIVAAIAINIEKPLFDTNKKRELNSQEMSQDGVEIEKYISDFLKKELADYLQQESSTAEAMLHKFTKSPQKG